jgi:hypothetical protein
MKTKRITPHPIANLFPMMDRVDIEALAKRVERVGLLEQGITLDGKLLDGRNRQEACAIAGVEFRTVDWKDLPEVLTKNGPVEYVISRNFDRRQLTKSQKAMVAAEMIPLLEADAKERSLSGLVQFAPAKGDGEKKPAESEQPELTPAADPAPPKRGPGRPRKDGRPPQSGKSAAIAAERVGVSTRMVESAVALQKKSPAAAKKVKEGKTTLSKAAKDEAKEAAKAKELEDAYKRIAAVCGRTLAQAARDGLRLKGRKEVLSFVEMSDDDMKRTQGLIESGWSVKRARLFRAVELTPKHKIDDLLNRAIAARGKFDTTIGGFTISVRREKE